MVATLSDPPPAPRRAFGGIVVALLYAAFLICAPLIVRYGPEIDATSATVAQVAGDHALAPPCGRAREPDRPCAAANTK